MYELMRYYFTKEFDVNWRQVEKKTSMGTLIDMVAFESQYPKLYTSWRNNRRPSQVQDIQLSFVPYVIYVGGAGYSRWFLVETIKRDT